MAIGNGGGEFSACWYGDRGCLGGQMILCGDIMGGQIWCERRGRIGLHPQKDIRREIDRTGRIIKYIYAAISDGA